MAAKESAMLSNMSESRGENENRALETTMKGDEQYIPEERETVLQTMDVDGIGLVSTLIDSGSNDCLIRRELLTDSIMEKIKPTKAKGTLYDGSGLDILGSIILPVQYLDKKFQIPFYVVAGLSDPMILGTNWIRYSGAILQSDGTKLVVTLGGKKQLEGCGPDCSFPYVSVEMDGFGTATARVDTGCGTSSIRRDLLPNFQMLKSSDVTILANGKEVKIPNSLSMDYTYQGITTCLENVNIVSEMDDEIIFGMDWIHKTRAVIQSDGSKIVVSAIF